MSCVKISDSQGKFLFLRKEDGNSSEEPHDEEEDIQENFESSSEEGDSSFFEQYVPGEDDESPFELDKIGSDFSDDL